MPAPGTRPSRRKVKMYCSGIPSHTIFATVYCGEMRSARTATCKKNVKFLFIAAQTVGGAGNEDKYVRSPLAINECFNFDSTTVGERRSLVRVAEVAVVLWCKRCSVRYGRHLVLMMSVVSRDAVGVMMSVMVITISVVVGEDVMMIRGVYVCAVKSPTKTIKRAMKLVLPPPKSFEDSGQRMEKTIKEKRTSSFTSAFTMAAHDGYR
ncbi:hypothetical protein ElyMa_001200300 [Elysia marginata]|uniref:Uncharacterized protein n=1 Tax=Elysia marginata TaxID=1093978 RepID=A0AAV4I8M3_9GAST|nr:hypothetical protein ElyMa_001200300 [Elysia marginata]